MPNGQGGEGPVGLVLAGGGARGAYELGALSVLLPALEERGERPRVVVGTSVGALNASFLAAGAHRPVDDLVGAGLDVWKRIRFEQVLDHLASPGALRRLAGYLGQFLGIRGARLDSLLDSSPLRETLREVVAFDDIERNVTGGQLDAAAVVATSAATSRSVVFHRGAAPREHDPKRGIDYVAGRITDEHVRASAAIPAVFPAVHVSSPDRARGWYFDGGTRLNTPIKPALELGARRIVVVALNSVAPAPRHVAGERRPDALEGAAQLIQAVLVDPLVADVETLATVNELIGGAETGAGDRRRVPYILVAPHERDAIGRRAQRVFAEHYSHLTDALGDLGFLGRAVAGGSDPAHGELLSYLFFAPELARELIELGRENAREWLAREHDDGPWAVGPVANVAVGG